MIQTFSWEKTMKIKAVLVLSILPILVTAGCEPVQQLLGGVPKPTARLAGMQFGDIDLKAATLLFDVEIDNPYTVALPLLNLDYAVASGQTPLFEGKADTQTVIPAKGKQSVSLPVKIGYMDFLNALAELKDVRPGSSIPYTADVGLSFNTEALGPLRLPLKKTGQVAIPELPKASDWKSILNRTLGQ
jgi:LEA14-like dessication related protein